MKLPSNVDSEDKDYGVSLRREKALAPGQWAVISSNMYMGCSSTYKILPSGAYEITVDDDSGKPIFIKKDLIHDDLIHLNGLPNQITQEIRDFWKKKNDFIKLGFLHRRGILLWGSHGCGKTSLIHEIIDDIIKDGGIVFYCNNPDFFNKGISLFREVEPERNIICVFEDIDATITKYGEHKLLSILDGENLISGVCNLATTNYPELLDKRIVGRPRRFDRVYKIENLDKDARIAFLKKKLPAGANQKEWVEKTDGMSIASISEMIISVFCFGKKIEEVLEIMKNLAKNKKSSDSSESGLGFSD